MSHHPDPDSSANAAECQGISPPPVAAELEKVLRSRVFLRARRLQHLLRYIVENLLRDPEGVITEHSVATDVLGRPASFDPRTDPIVRVEAHRLRCKLQEYYATEGRRDTVEIALPARGYLPSIRHRPLPGEALPETLLFKAVAAVPFANLDAGQEGERWLKGFTAELLNALAQLQGIRVFIWHSSGPEKARDQAAQSRVDALLEGSIRIWRRKINVAVRLVGCVDGALLWSRMHDCATKDAGAPRELAQTVAQGVTNALGLSRRGGVSPVSNSGKAQRLFLKGRYHLEQRSAQGLRKSIECFQSAAAEDPTFALPYCGLAETYTLLGIYGTLPATEIIPKVRDAALRAYEMDDGLAPAHVGLGIAAALLDWDLGRAEREFTRALQTDPEDARCHHWHSCCCLVPSGRLGEALEHARRAVQLNPLSLPVNNGLAWVLHFSGRSEEALDQLHETLEIEPDFFLTHWSLGLVYQEMDASAKSIAAFEKARSLCDLSFVLGALGHARAAFGMKRKAREALEELHTMAGKRYVPALDIASVYIGLGEVDHAFEWLAKAAEEHCPWLMWLAVDPRTKPLRSDPRFQALVHHLGLGRSAAAHP